MNGDITQKLNQYRGYYQEDPENISLLCQLIDLEMRAGNLKKVKDLIDNGYQISTDDAGLKFRYATLAIANGQSEEAIQYLSELVKDGVNAPAIQYNLAYAALLSSDADMAYESLKHVESSSSELPRFHLLMSRILHHLGNLEEATEHAEQQYVLSPNDNELLGHLAILYGDQHKNDKAKELGLKALEQNENNHEALIAVGSAELDEQEIDQAELYYRRAIETRPESGRAWMGEGLVKMANMDLENAISDLKKSVKYMPTYIGAWHALAWAQIVTNDLGGAEESLNSAMEIDHNFGETHGGLAVIAVMRGDMKKASHEIKIGKRLNPNSFSARFAESLMSGGSSNTEKMTEQLKAIFESEIMPGRGKLMDMLGKLMKRQNITKS